MNDNRQLMDLVQQWIDENPTKRSYAALGRIIDLPAHKVRRILLGEAPLELGQCANILSVVTTQSVSYEFLSSRWPSGLGIIKGSLTAYSTPISMRDVESMPQMDAIAAMIAASGSTAEGISSKEISSEFGADGIDKAKQMLEAGILRQSGESFHMIGWPLNSPNEILNGVDAAVSLYRRAVRQSDNKKRRTMTVHHNAVSQVVFEKLVDATKQYFETVSQLIASDVDGSNGEAVVPISLCALLNANLRAEEHTK